MKKIPSVFIRNPEDRSHVLDLVEPCCQWVIDGEGVATRKYDGTCCLITKDAFMKRRTVREGKTPPKNFVLADTDLVTGKLFGWVPVNPADKSDWWHMDAFSNLQSTGGGEKGTYELVGPKIRGNPEGFKSHRLIRHADADIYDNVPRTFDGLYEFFKGIDIEGLVFHHQDGRMAKIKEKDFGLDRYEITEYVW